MDRRDVLGLALSALSLSIIRSRGAAAQARYPDRPIRLIVPRSAGGVVDVVARLWGEQVKPQLGTVIVENQGGGGGIIAAAAVARARPDGYTLLAGTTSELVISPAIISTPGHDPVRDLAPVATTAISVSALMVHASLPVHTLKELVAYAKANPGKLSYGSAGVGTTAHLCGELFKQIAGLPDIVHVPYRAPIRDWWISTAASFRCLPPRSRRRCSPCIGRAGFGFSSLGPIGGFRRRRRFRPMWRRASPISLP